jgi:hypothetical protein
MVLMAWSFLTEYTALLLQPAMCGKAGESPGVLNPGGRVISRQPHNPLISTSAGEKTY